jgi:hypothetical protein
VRGGPTPNYFQAVARCEPRHRLETYDATLHRRVVAVGARNSPQERFEKLLDPPERNVIVAPKEKTARRHPLALFDANLSSIQAYTDLVALDLASELPSIRLVKQTFT